MADLRPYRAKRRFARTPEPSGAEAPAAQGAVFVVQKHAARRLHYDLRLEIGGVLKSWAVPEGPCLDPKVRRFAKQTEDHPLAYAGFEGVIPQGEYGGGEMIVWDRGAWATPADDIAAALAKGELKFRLAGEKLSGGWMLKRLPKGHGDWLLIKERDPAARPLEEYDIRAARPESVLSGRTVEALRAEPPPPPPPADAPDPAAIPGAQPAPFPQRIAPQLAVLAQSPPAQAGWVHEIKYDGYRMLAHIADGAVVLRSRNGLDWTHRCRALARALAALPCASAVLDGEVAVQDAQGVTRLDLLERALADGRDGALVFFAFDLVFLNGWDLSGAALCDRKAALRALLAPALGPKSPVQYSDHVEGDGAALFAHASRLGLEGVVSKRADARYVQARAPSWVKVKRVETALLPVIGFTTNAPKAVAALILAEEREDGLAYCCRAGSGISDAKAEELYELLRADLRAAPVVAVPKTPKAHWVEPHWLAEIGYRGRSAAHTPRAPTFLRLTRRGQPSTTPAGAARARKPRLVRDGDLAAIRLTNPEREVFEGSGVCKLDLALYYARVGDWALPEILQRPLSLIRCPSGRRDDCFYQRHAFSGLPPGLDTIDLAEEEGRGAYLTVTEPRGYLALAQYGAIELHVWGCRVMAPEQPDRLVMDLDPDPDLPWAQVCDAAEAVRARMQALGLAPFLRTTGGKGLHLVCALAPKADWAEVKGFAAGLARAMAADEPKRFVAMASKAKRQGKVFLDYLRNGRGATAIASYSLRARPGFPVAAPVFWEELRTLPGADAFDRISVLQRLQQLTADPWEDLQGSASIITQKMRRSVGMAA